ncbi:hypothetical protein JCM3774_003994 [Rhodotorula dairenensis]
MADALKQAGNKLFAAKEYLKAVKKYTDALAKDLSDDEAAIILANRSAAYTLLNKYDLAVADAEHAAERRPQWPKAQVRLAEALSRKHAFLQAEAAWKLAIEYSESETDRARYTQLMEQAKQAAEKTLEKNKPRQKIFGKLDSADDTWFAKLERAQREGRPPPPSTAGLNLSCFAWHKCEDSWKEIDAAVEVFPDKQAKTQVSHPFTLPGLVDTILSDHAAFHITWYIKGKWNGTRIIDDLDKQIAEKGRERVRRMTASVIYGRIIAAFLTTTSSQWGVSAETYRLAIDILEAGNRKWAHEDLDTRGNVFSPTIVRSTKLQVLRCLTAGRETRVPAERHRKGGARRARRVFRFPWCPPLNPICMADSRDKQDKLPESFWTGRDDFRFRLAFDNLPHWEAIAAFGLVHSQRAMKPLGDFPRGKVVFADLDEARKSAKFYDEAAALMPDDYHGKGLMLWCALYAHLRAGGLRVAAIRDRFAAAERVDAIVEPYFGLPSNDSEQYKFCQTQTHSLGHIPPASGDAGVVDILGLPSNLQ